MKKCARSFDFTLPKKKEGCPTWPSHPYEDGLMAVRLYRAMNLKGYTSYFNIIRSLVGDTQQAIANNNP